MGLIIKKKPDKLRVVFDCSAKFCGISLNDTLLKGPDLINSLIGVLCRFRRESVAIICDIERVLHQFLIVPEHPSYLRYLWWEHGDFDQEPKEYQMTISLVLPLLHAVLTVALNIWHSYTGSIMLQQLYLWKKAFMLMMGL